MGMSYRRFLIPQPQTFCPTPAAIFQLIERLTAGQWLPTLDSPALEAFRSRAADLNPKRKVIPAPFPMSLIPGLAKRFEKVHVYSPFPKFVDAPRPVTVDWLAQQCRVGLLLNYSVKWPARDTLQYPLSRLDHDLEATYYDINIASSPDYVYYTSESLQGPSAIKCACGEELNHERPDDVFLCEHLPLNCPHCGNLFDPSSCEFEISDPFSSKRYTTNAGSIYRLAIELDCNKCGPKSGGVTFAQGFREASASVLQCDFIELECLS